MWLHRLVTGVSSRDDGHHLRGKNATISCRNIHTPFCKATNPGAGKPMKSIIIKRQKMKNNPSAVNEPIACDQAGKLCIETALQRNWTIPHRHIRVAVLAGRVTLSGTTDTKHAFDEAGKLAWQASGVISVSNHIVVNKETTGPHAG